MSKTKNAMSKDFFMEIKNSFSRFISIFLIVALGVAFYTGVRSSEPDMKFSIDKQYDEAYFMDIRLISSQGILQTDIDRLKENEYVERIEGINSVDVLIDTGEAEDVMKVWSYNDKVNVPTLEAGRFIENNNECIIDDNYLKTSRLKLGDVITLKSGDEKDIGSTLEETTFTIVGTFTSPMYLSLDKGTTTIGNGKINGVVMINPEVFQGDYYKEAYITVKDAASRTTYTKVYNDLIKKAKASIEKDFVRINKERYDKILELMEQNIKAQGTDGVQIQMPEISEPKTYVLDRNSIITYVEYEQDTERINSIGKVVPMIFFIVAALVSLTTMTRMVEEQRIQIGTLKALGYSKLTIAGKYFWYALSATLLGAVIGGLLGSIIFPKIILSTYKILYDNLKYIVIRLVPEYFLTAVVLAVGCVVLATMIACMKELMASPAILMRPVAPKPGKRILLERIPFIWNHLNFSRKSTFRNLLRYKKRLFMTLFGIGGCMSLLLVGFGLEDSINDVVDKQYGELNHYNLVVSIEPGTKTGELEKVYTYLETQKGIEDYITIKNSAATFSTDSKSVSGYIYVTSDKEKFQRYFTLRNRRTDESYHLSEDGVIVSEKMAKLLKIKKGDRITLKLSDSVMADTVVTDIVENYVYHNIYMTENVYKQCFGEMEVNQILIKLDKSGLHNEEAITKDILAMKGAGGATYIDAMRDKFGDMLGSLDVIVVVLVVSAGGLAFVVLYNLNNINITERKRELATLKVLGFYDGEVSQYIFRENVIITIVGILLGIIGGLILHIYVISTIEVDMVMFGREVKPWSYVYSILITAVFAAIVNISMHFKLKKVDMATSLKSAE